MMLQPPTLTPNANGEEFRGSVSTDRSSASPSNIDVSLDFHRFDVKKEHYKKLQDI